MTVSKTVTNFFQLCKSGNFQKRFSICQTFHFSLIFLNLESNYNKCVIYLTINKSYFTAKIRFCASHFLFAQLNQREL